ncbi:thiopurine S-methyltransferase [Solilutibacter tolerans]|uniref:Thiopurine S-methyltransferase n=1 Tax=Solilutibacter tolerans TaxID=1604334 RepID=A0A1N6P653_9GAMM|nr:thiopurine S-methyltransferase [Lysobacter tolerans]SIP99736.1 thiopurine S-methyltransferase [Lysobacter tolerans]
MEADYWKSRWLRGETGWHRDEVMPLLLRHWPSLHAKPGSEVLVPLSGKTLDMPWLAAQGQRVLGIELSERAIKSFFLEQELSDVVSDTPDGPLHRANDIAILEADAFEVSETTLSGIRHVYDRAALIALPPELRQRYVDTLYARLPAGTNAVLITLEYPQHEKDGPPFSVSEDEVYSLFSRVWDVALLERRDILQQQPSFVADGVSALQTAVYRLDKR